jgi:hypothetical protein
MTGAQVFQLQTHSRGAVPAGAMDTAVTRVRGLLRLAPGPVLFGRIKLTMAADPAVERPATAQARVDLRGRLVVAEASGQTMHEAIGHMCDRLRARLEHSERDWSDTRPRRRTA